MWTWVWMQIGVMGSYVGGVKEGFHFLFEIESGTGLGSMKTGLSGKEMKTCRHVKGLRSSWRKMEVRAKLY